MSFGGMGRATYDTGDSQMTPRDFINDTHPPYDEFFAQHPIPLQTRQMMVYWNGFYFRYQPVNVARSIASLDYNATFGRPMGSAMGGGVNYYPPQAIPSRFPNPFLPSGAPLSIAAWVKATTAHIMKNRTGWI